MSLHSSEYKDLPLPKSLYTGISKWIKASSKDQEICTDVNIWFRMTEWTVKLSFDEENNSMVTKWGKID